MTSKLPYDAHETEVAEKSLKESLEKLKTDYLDLYLIHAPIPSKVSLFSNKTLTFLITSLQHRYRLKLIQKMQMENWFQ